MADRKRRFEADIPYVHSTMNNITLLQLQAESYRVFATLDLNTKLQPLKQIKERNRQVSHENTLEVLRSLISETLKEVSLGYQQQLTRVLLLLQEILLQQIQK